VWVAAIASVSLAVPGAGALARADAARPRAGDPPSPTPRLTNPRALMLAARARDVLVGAEATSGRLRLTVIPADVRRLKPERVRAVLGSARGTRRLRRTCGWNCVQLDGADVLRGRAATLRVDVTLPARTVRATLTLPARIPPAGGALYDRARRSMNRLRTVRIRQVMSNGFSDLRSTWLYQAPDRSSYVASNGARGVIIGERRWDYFAGRWTAQATTPLPSPRYMWAGAGRPRILGSASRRGRRVQVLAVFRPNGSYPAFFKLYVERGGRVLEAEMLAPAHFMVDRLDRFNAPIRISPPE
jgi:hypothetical protein